jgi:hypothetical protein
VFPRRCDRRDVYGVVFSSVWSLLVAVCPAPVFTGGRVGCWWRGVWLLVGNRIVDASGCSLAVADRCDGVGVGQVLGLLVPVS